MKSSLSCRVLFKKSLIHQQLRYQSQTLIEKIVQSFLPKKTNNAVRAGDYVSIQPRHVMTHDNTSAVMLKFKELQAGTGVGIANPRQPVFTLDHNVQDTSPQNLSKYEKIKQFAKQYNIDFYPAGRGIGHQV